MNRRDCARAEKLSLGLAVVDSRAELLKVYLVLLDNALKGLISEFSRADWESKEMHSVDELGI